MTNEMMQLRALVEKNPDADILRGLLSEKCIIFRTQAILAQDTDLRSRLLARIASKPDAVWTPGDFADLGGRAAIDKTQQRHRRGAALHRPWPL